MSAAHLICVDGKFCANNPLLPAEMFVLAVTGTKNIYKNCTILQRPCVPRSPTYTCRIVSVCVCVFFPFILDIKFVGRTSRGHTGGRSHRISHPPYFCGACLNFSREKDSAIPFPRRPWSRILCTNDLIVLHPLGIFFCFFVF